MAVGVSYLGSGFSTLVKFSDGCDLLRDPEIELPIQVVMEFLPNKSHVIG